MMAVRLLLLTVCCSLTWAAEGIRLRPAIVLIQGQVPGEQFSFKQQTGSTYLLGNHTPEGIEAEAVARIPLRQPSQYEPGYEPPPSGEWFSTAPTRFALASGAEQAIDLLAAIPDDPAYCNRHWMVYVECGPPGNMALGAVLRLRARVLLETRAKALPIGLPPSGRAHLAPSVIVMAHHEDGSWSGSTRLGNGTTDTATFDLLRFDQLWGGDLKRAPRYFRNPQEAVLDEHWAQSPNESWQIASGSWQDLQFTASPDHAFEGAREEVLFLARRAVIAPSDESEMPDDTQEKTHGRSPRGQVEQTKATDINPIITINDVDYDHVELLRVLYLPPEQAAVERAAIEETP